MALKKDRSALKKRIAILCFGFFLRAVIFSCSVAAAEDGPVADPVSSKVFSEILSPFCPGRSLNDCPSQKAHELKDSIRQQLKEGKSPDAVVENVVAEYGEQYRASPKLSGFGWVAWCLPFIFVGLGIFAIIAKVRGISKSEALPSQPLKLSEEDKIRIERELASLKDD